MIGTEVSLQAPWLKAVNSAIGAASMAEDFEGVAAVRADERPGLQT